MGWYEYTALTRGGVMLTGRMESPDHAAAMRELADANLDVRDLTEAGAPPDRHTSIGSEDLIFFNEQLASLAQAGIALDEGLAQLARDIESPRLRGWIQGLVEDLQKGQSLDQAVAAREKGLPLLYSRVIRAGIQTGELPATLLNLNQHLRFAGNTRRIIWETVSYPLFVAVLGLLISSFFFIMVVPQFKEIFTDFDTALPGLTLIVLSMAEHFVPALLVAGAVLAAGIVAWRALRYTAWGRDIRDGLVGVVPVLGRIHRASLLARFFRSVSTAVGTGLGLPEALRLGAGATGSSPLIVDAERLAVEVESGRSIFVANQGSRMIPPLFGFCVQTAVGRDALPQAIDKLAHSYESRALHAQSMLRTLLFPLTVVFLGCVLGVCIAGLFLPLVSLIQCMTG